MDDEQAEQLLEIARQNCKGGLYAIKRGDYIELKDEVASPLLVLEYEAHGWEVYDY